MTDQTNKRLEGLRNVQEHLRRKIVELGQPVPNVDTSAVEATRQADESEEEFGLRKEVTFLRSFIRSINEGSDASSHEDIEAQRDEYLAGWKRALADYENLQKQNAQARADDKRRNAVNLAYDLLPVVDNFDQALKHAPADIDKNWFAGVQHIARQFSDALSALNITPIDAVGKPFDPNLHESGGSKWDEDKPEHTVLEELVKGWKLGDTVIRPSKVIVNQQE